MLLNYAITQVKRVSGNATCKRLRCIPFFSLFFIILGTNANAAPPAGANYYVSASGGSDANSGLTGFPKQTIQAAVNAAANGDIINVDAGTYNEEVTVNKSLTILGANMNTAGNATRVAESILDGNNGTHSGFVLTANNVIVNGFKITGCVGTYTSGVYVSPSVSGSQILYNYITDNVIGAYPSCNGTSSVKFNLFDGNNRSGPSGGSGIYIENTINLTIEGNEFKNHVNNSAVIFAANAVNAHQGLIFTSNYIHGNNNSNSMVYATGVTNGTFSYNSISGGLRGFKIAGGCSNITIQNNLLSGNTEADIRVSTDGFSANTNVQASSNSLTSAISINNSDAPFISASCNWYGTAVQAGIMAKLIGNVNYAPWLDNGTNAARIGFTPAAANCTSNVKNVTQSKYYATIQQAIDDAVSGDSINIKPGTYTEILTINKSLSFSGAGVGQCGTGSRPASETKLIAPVNPGSQLINLSGAVTANFDGFEIDSTFIIATSTPTQNLAIRNSVFNLDFLPSNNNIAFSGNALTLECNYFKAVKGSNDGAASHIIFGGASLIADNNIFTSNDAISVLYDPNSSTTTSLPVWINLSLNANNININHNNFTKVDIGILLGINAGNAKIWNNEFSQANRESYGHGLGMGAGIVIFDNLTPIGPISVRYNKFLNSETGIRTSTADGNNKNFPAPNLLSFAYNSFENFSDKAIRISGQYANSQNNLNALCNWFGNITGPTISTNSTNIGASGAQILDGGGKVSYKNWLNYGTDANAGELGFQLPTAVSVVPGSNTSQAENHYRVLSNAIGCAVYGQTLTLTGTFNFGDPIAQVEWAKGNNGNFDNIGTVTGAGGDDYTITAPDSVTNVTLMAASLGSVTIHSPGDVDTVSLETPLFFDSRSAASSHKKWTISNLIFDGFDASIFADNNGGPANVMDTLTITNNTFNIPADWNATAKPKDNFQNIGIDLNFGKGQTISNNTFNVDGTGISDAGNSKYSTSVVLQSTTSGGSVYDGLKIINNSIHVTGVPYLTNPAKILGLWENSNNQNASIELSGNTFVNDNPANLAANNLQLAFRVTSFSGDASHQVVYKNNEVTGFNRGISFIGDPFSNFGPNSYAIGENPVVIINNKFDKYKVGVSVIKDAASPNTGSPAIINNNSFTHVAAGGLAISNESSGLPTAATCNWYDTVLVGNIINGNVTYLPKLNNGTDADPSTTGFQVDPSNTCVSPVLIVRTGVTYTTIQAAVDAAIAGDSIFVSEGIYPENVVVNKALKITGKDSALVIVDKGNANYNLGDANDITNDIGFNITANNVSLKKMKVRNYGNAVRSTVAVNTLSLDSMSLIENYHNGFYTNQNLDSLVIKNSTLSYNGFKGGVRSPNSNFRRGVFVQGSSSDFSRFNIHDNLAEYNGLVGIDINLSHSMSGLTIQNNTSRYNFDEQIGVWLGNNNETMGAILVKGNTLTLRDSAHYGMEMRMPHGTTMESGNGSVFIQGNTIGVVSHVNSVKDMAAIAIIRRKENDATVINDQPQGVVIKDNVISDFRNGSNSGSAFGIVVGGIGHRISGNNISNTQVPIQLQKGNENAGNNGNSGAPAVPNNEYFDRDNSSDACAEIGANTITTSGDSRIVTGPSIFSTILPPTPVTNTTIAVKFCSIQSAIGYSRTTSGNTIQADAGLYAEDIIVNKPLTILGPNSAVNPCSGTRVAEAVVVPKTEATSSGEIFHVAASNVTISGFTINGDNPNLTSGYLGVNNADIDAAEGVTIYEPNINNLTVSNNIIKNLAYFGVTLNGDDITNTPSSGHSISNNKFLTLGTYNPASGIDRWGGGVLLYNNQYAAVTNNCMDSVRLGVQTGNYYSANPGAATYQVIDGNTMTNVRRFGIIHNLSYGSASPFTVSNNSIAGIGNVNETKWDGVGMLSLSVPSTTSNNAVDATNVPQSSSGIEVWNVAKATPAVITGGTVTNATRGVFVNNYDGFVSDATFGANATISGITINNAAADTGILLYDNPLSSHIKVSASIGAGVTINNGLFGLVLQKDSTAITSMGNVAFAGQSSDYIRLINTKSSFDATTATFGGLTGATATLAQNFAIEDKITHKIDSTILGFVTVKAANDFVTLNSYFAPSTAASVQRGVDAASTGFTVNVSDGIYNGDVAVNKSITLLGQSTAAIIRGLYAGATKTVTVSANNVTVKDVTITRNYGTTLAEWQASSKTEGLAAENLSGLTLDHIIVKDNRNGLLIHSTPGFILKNSTIRDNRTGAQLFGNLDNGQIINNFINNNFTHAIVVNFDQGPTSGNSLLINNNDLSNNWYSQITFQNTGTPGVNVGSFTNFNANCNWYGSLFPVYNATNPTLPAYASQAPSQFSGTDPGENSDIRGVEAALITYKPYLQSGIDNDPVANGFQPVPGTCNMAPTKLYVNDTYTPGTDVYTTGTGNDATGLGTPALPFASISRAIAGAEAGDTIYVDGGNYFDPTPDINIVVDRKVNIFGPNYGVNPTVWANAPANIYPLVSDPNPNTGYPLMYMPPAASGSRIDGVVLDGNNPNIGGADINSVGAIQAYEGLSNVIVQNNKIQNFSDVGVTFYNYYNSGAITSGNLIYQNKFDNILSASSGVGVLIYNNCYTSIINNTMTGVSVGVQTGNFYQADTSSFHSITKNKIQSQVLGIWANLHYNNASTYDVSFDTLTNFASATPVQSMGIRVQSIQGNTGVNVSYNNITGNKYGVGLSNCPTTNTIRVKGGNITGTDVGVWATNSFNTNNPNATSSSFIVDSVSILNTTYAGIEVTDSSLTTNGSTVALALTDKDTINNTTTGLLLQGANASAAFTGAATAAFKNQTKYIDQISNGTTVPNTNIDAALVSFDGQLGSAMSLADLYNTEDKINHKIDVGTLGFVVVKANNDYVTPLSFIAPATTTPKIQRGVDAASNGFNVNVKQGTYAENVLVNKSVSLLGAKVGLDANTRFGAFLSLKADPMVETIVTAPVDNPLNGNPNANDLIRVTANNVTIDGFTIDGNNIPLGGSLVGEGGTFINARRGITNIDANDNFNPVSSLTVQNNIIQNIAQRGISLNNNGPVSTGNVIASNVIRSFGADPVNGGQAVILFNNAYANITGNTINVPHDQIGLHLQNFYTNGTMTWSANNVTVGQNGFGIHANNFYAPAGVLNISGNTVNAATGVTGTSDSTWGINVWSILSGSTVNVANNNVGNLGGSGTFARGINLWSMPTSNMVTVSGGSVANAVVGINLDNIDLFFGAGSSTMAKVTGTTITASQSGVRARAASLATPPSGGSNTVSGSVSLTLDNVPINVSGTTKGVLVNAPAASLPNMATVYLTNNTAVNNTSTSDTAVLISGSQAQLVAATSNIKVGGGAYNAIQFNDITSGNTVSNLILAGGTTINLNGNNAAKAFASPQYSIVEVDAAAGWTAPDSAANGNQSVLIDGSMKFTSGVLNAGNSTIEFGTDALDIMTSASTVLPENNSSYILGNAKMLSRPVANAALDMLGVRLGAQGDASANVGNMNILRTTRLAPPINPPFPGNNSILTTWAINPSITTSSRSDVQFRYLSNSTNLNGQSPSSMYSYRYTGGQWIKVSAALSYTSVGNVLTTTSFGVPGFSPWTLSSQSSLDAPDLAPFITLSSPSFTTANPSRPVTINVYNVGTASSNGADFIRLFVLKPSPNYTTFALTNDASGTGSWSITDFGSFYAITSLAKPVIGANFDSISLTGTLSTLPGVAPGNYTFSVSLAGNSGGETNNTNNSTSTAINVNN